jgi:hypothetical protein
MSYYDFNDHFWSPQEVCGKLEVQNEEKSFWKTQFIKSIRQRFSRSDKLSKRQ